jgi:hypothetical protein
LVLLPASGYTESIVSLKKISQHPVWSNAIGGIIAATVIALAGFVYRKSWWPAVRRGASAAWAYLLAGSSLPHWAVGLLVLGDMLFVGVVVGLVVITLQAKSRNQNPPDWMSYTSDNFCGLNWVWAYEGREVLLKGVLCQCGYQVGPDSTSMFDSSVRFHCDSCGRTVPVEGQSWDSLQSVVMRLIQQKLRNGTYPKAGRPSAA